MTAKLLEAAQRSLRGLGAWLGAQAMLISVSSTVFLAPGPTQSHLKQIHWAPPFEINITDCSQMVLLLPSQFIYSIANEVPRICSVQRRSRSGTAWLGLLYIGKRV